MTLNLTKLKEAAEKATPGPWAQQSGSVLAGGCTDTYSGRVLGSICYCEPTTQTDTEGRTWSTSGTAKENAAYIALANPATILALIERLESAEEIVRAFTGDPHIGHIEAARAHMEKHNAKP